MPMLQLLAMGLALSASDICAVPIFDSEAEGGQPFCLIEEAQEVETPYFVVKVLPRVLVWLHDDGRTLSIESSIHQSPISLSIAAKELPSGEIPETMRAYGCPDIKISPGVRVLCDKTDGEYVFRSYAILDGAKLISIELSAGPLAKHELASYEAIVNSIATAP